MRIRAEGRGARNSYARVQAKERTSRNETVTGKERGTLFDHTTEPKLKSFIETRPDSHFPIQNLPFGVFRKDGTGGSRVGVRIGEYVLDLVALEELGFLDPCRHLKRGVFGSASLNPFLALGRPAWKEARSIVSGLLGADESTIRDDAALRERVLLPVDRVELLLPVQIGDYTDFYSSKEHAANVGAMLRGRENALMPNWVHLPVAYHGRASSVVLSETSIHRPCGQVNPKGVPRPFFAPSRSLDFELEMGFFVGTDSELGKPVPIGEAQDHIFGLVLVNDWSGRDIQKWEYQPLGPFNAKNFATTISPWVVTLEALAPFRCAGPEQDPPPLPYLSSEGEQAYDICLEVWLKTGQMIEGVRISQSNFKYLYWNMCQQLAHHTVTGCNLRTGDLMASGTISAPDARGFGSMLELSKGGKEPIILPNGEKRAFLEDGDTVTLTGWCQGAGYRVGFGEAVGKVLPPLVRDHPPAET